MLDPARLLGLSCTPPPSSDTPKSASFGDGRLHSAFTRVGRPSFGVWLELPSNLPQRHPASAPCTSIAQFDLYWAAAARLVFLSAGFGWCLEPPCSGMSPSPCTGHPVPTQPTPEHKQTAAVPRLRQCWTGSDQALPKPDDFSHGREKKKKPTSKLLLRFSSFPNTSDLGFLIKSPPPPPHLELPLGTSHLQTCPRWKTCFSIKLSFDWRSFSIRSVWLVMSTESRETFRWENLHAAAPRDGLNIAGEEEIKIH